MRSFTGLFGLACFGGLIRLHGFRRGSGFVCLTDFAGKVFRPFVRPVFAKGLFDGLADNSLCRHE